MRHIRLLLVTSLVSLLMLAPPVFAQKNETVRISGFKSSSTTEYITIINASESAQDISGWKIEYSNASGSNVRTIATLSGVLESGKSLHFGSPNFIAQFVAPDGVEYLPMEYSGLADSGGYLRLLSATGDTENYPDGFVLEDQVGWTSSSSSSDEEVIVSVSGLFYLRCFDNGGQMVVRGSSQLDFVGLVAPHDETDNRTCPDLIEVPEDEPPDEEGSADEDNIDPPELANRCEGVVINEVLPNPSGADAGREYVELYNTTLVEVPMSGCQISATGDVPYIFPIGTILGPGEYLTISDTALGFNLVNSQSLTVYLLSEDNAEMSVVTYPANLEDDQSYALFDDTYASTYTATPGAKNIATPDKPCAEGYQRNLGSGRCIKLQAEPTALTTACDVAMREIRRQIVAVRYLLPPLHALQVSNVIRIQIVA